MDNGDKIEEKGIISSKYLMVILLIFAILIIGLVIAIILFRDSSKNDDGHYSNENNIEASDFESNDEYLEMLEENDRSYQKSLEISEIYNSGDKEKAFNMYNEELNRALEFQDFGFYNDLVTAMSTMLSDLPLSSLSAAERYLPQKLRQSSIRTLRKATFMSRIQLLLYATLRSLLRPQR